MKFKSMQKKILQVISLPHAVYFLLMEKYIISFPLKTRLQAFLEITAFSPCFVIGNLVKRWITFGLRLFLYFPLQ